MIKEIQEKLVSAIKSKDKKSVFIFRDMKSRLIEAKKIKGSVLSDDNILDIFKKMAKQRQQSIDACGVENKYMELKCKEEFELSIIQEYLPTQMDQKEITDKLIQIIVNLDISPSLNNIGTLMKAFNEKYKGQNGKLVSNIARECLST